MTSPSSSGSSDYVSLMASDDEHYFSTSETPPRSPTPLPPQQVVRQLPSGRLYVRDGETFRGLPIPPITEEEQERIAREIFSTMERRPFNLVTMEDQSPNQSLGRRAVARQSGSRLTDRFTQRSSRRQARSHRRRQRRSAAYNLVERRGQGGTLRCVWCREFADHPHNCFDCPLLYGLSAQQLVDLADDNSRCFNCLGTHRRSLCNSRRVCRICRQRHHSLLHGARLWPTPRALRQQEAQVQAQDEGASSSQEGMAVEGQAVSGTIAVRRDLLPDSGMQPTSSPLSSPHRSPTASSTTAFLPPRPYQTPIPAFNPATIPPFNGAPAVRQVVTVWRPVGPPTDVSRTPLFAQGPSFPPPMRGALFVPRQVVRHQVPIGSVTYQRFRHDTPNPEYVRIIRTVEYLTSADDRPNAGH